jgi:hypothetical protein
VQRDGGYAAAREYRAAVADELLDSEGDLARPTLIDAMRGTNFLSGRRWLREQGLEARYLDALPPAVREAVLAADASAWIPMHIVLPHYVALDSLELTFEQRVELGASVSRNINGVVLTTIARLAGRAGLTPLTPLARAAKLFARNYRGGAAAVYRTGMSEARFEVHGAPMAPSTCHRDNVLAAFLDGARPFARDVRVTEIAAMRSATSYALRVRW